MTRKQELLKMYEDLKEKDIVLVTLFIQMPTGEIEVISNPAVAEKMNYIDRTYDDNLVHGNCKDIVINGYKFGLASETYTFGDVVYGIRNGRKFARQGWNGKGMYIYYVPAASYPASTDVAKKEFGEMVPYNAYFAIKNVNGTVSTWVPSVNDCLAEDWYIVE